MHGIHRTFTYRLPLETDVSKLRKRPSQVKHFLLVYKVTCHMRLN